MVQLSQAGRYFHRTKFLLILWYRIQHLTFDDCAVFCNDWTTMKPKIKRIKAVLYSSDHPTSYVSSNRRFRQSDIRQSTENRTTKYLSHGPYLQTWHLASRVWFKESNCRITNEWWWTITASKYHIATASMQDCRTTRLSKVVLMERVTTEVKESY